MKGSRQEILKHDWQIFKARYMLAGEFKKIEDEFMALCEAECFEALSVYSATVNSRFSAKIEKMIASYPDKNPHEVLQQRMFGRASAEDYHKALIKQNFKNRNLIQSMTPDDWMLQIIAKQGCIVGRQTNESLALIMMAEPLSEENDIAYLSYISSILLSGAQLSNSSYMALVAIASQPYSDIVQAELTTKKNGEENLQ